MTNTQVTDTQVIQKYGISDQELIYIQAMCYGTTMHSDIKDIEKLQPARRGPVAHVDSFSDKSYNRAMTLCLFLSSEELTAIL